MKWLRALLIAVAAICLAFGLSLPIIRLERLYFFEERPTLIELVASLFEGGEIVLGIVVGLFSIVFPITKLLALALQLLLPARQSGWSGRIMAHLSRWSMMDVMLVAIAVFAARTSGFAVAATQPGLWFYAASAVIAGLLPVFSGDHRR